MISIIKHRLPTSYLIGRKCASLRSDLTSIQLQELELDGEPHDSLTGSEIQLEGGARRQVRVLGSGVVGEVRRLNDGRRQIIGLRFPGDVLTPADGEAMVALTPVRTVGGAKLMDCLTDGDAQHQQLRRAWVVAARVDQAILRDQVVRLGRMSAFERTAHFLLEAHERISQVGLASQASFHLPLTQEMLSDVIGLSVVHLNRTLQALRRGKLIVAKQSYVTLADRDRLVEVAGYVSRFPAPWRAEASAPQRAERAAYA